MKEYFKKITTSVLVLSIIAFIIGLLMAVIPGISLQVMGVVVGVFVIIQGCVLILLNFLAHSIYIPFYGIMSGILSVVVGLILIAMPNALSTIFAIALGIWIILSSVNTISIAISVKDAVSNWYLWLILGIIDLICGFIILFNPFASSLSIVVLGGIIIMIHSVITIVDTIMIKRDAKEIAKTFTSKIKELGA